MNAKKHEMPTEKNLWSRRNLKEFPGGPVVRTPHFQCRENGFDPRSGNSNLTAFWSEKMLGMISIFLNLPRLDLWPRM